MTMKQLPPADRPRERLARYGGEVLSNIELLAIVLGSGTKKCSALELAAQLLSHFGSLRGLLDASLVELKKIKGIGNAKAVQLQATFALQKRFEEQEQGLLLDSPQVVYETIRGEFANKNIEMLMVILRDVRRRQIHQEIISIGTLTELLMHPREIFNIAIRHHAHSFIIAHNHPSGDPTPSTRDMEMTLLLASASKIMGIQLVDHLVLGSAGFTSYFATGLLRSQELY